MSKNRLKVTAAGGAAISIADKVIKNIALLGDGFIDIDIKYIDTSRADIDKIEHDPKDFWLVESEDFASAEIMGSGAERKTNVKPIMANTKKFLDENGFHKRVPTEYHLVVASASGGSGNIIQTMLVKHLLERDIPVIVLLIGDSSNALSAINTLNTIAGLNNVATKHNKPLSVMYVNNHDFSDDTKLSGVENANKAIFNTLSVLALFLSGDNESLDNQDMINIIDQSNYSTIQVEPGLYSLTTYAGDVVLPQGVIPTVARTLVIDGVSPDINLQLLHHKSGLVTSDNVKDIFKQQFPLHLVSSANFFTLEEVNLKTITDEYYSIMNNIKVNKITGTSESSDDDSGLVF